MELSSILKNHCTECITRGMCRAMALDVINQFNHKYQKPDILVLSAYRFALEPRCSLIRSEIDTLMKMTEKFSVKRRELMVKYVLRVLLNNGEDMPPPIVEREEYV